MPTPTTRVRKLIALTTILLATPPGFSSDIKLKVDSRVTVSVWSSFSGWGLEVDGCNNTQQQACYNPLVRYNLLLPPEDAHPHNPKDGEGLTLTVLNQRNAAVIFHKVFPLGYYWAHYADLQWHLDRVAPGRILVLTVAVSGTVGLRQAAQQLAGLGSLFALHLTPMAHWTWVFVKGGRTISETVILQGLAQHQAHLVLPLSDVPTPTAPSNQTLQQQRWHYCHLHAAMGGLCDEHTPDPLPPPPPPTLQHQSALADVPVVVTAGARHQYLYHTLNTLLTAPGAQRNNVLVVLGDAPQPTTQLLRLINVNFTKVPVHGEGNLKLFRYYRSVFQLVARTFPDAPAVIFLDEDVEVSPDFFSFMSQTLWLLREDPTLYCINGYGGSKELSYDEAQVLRSDTQVSWGYAVSLDFVREALTYWQIKQEGSMYDYWLYSTVAKGRECAMPILSRTRHYGIGMNTEAWIHEFFFLNNPTVQVPMVQLEQVARLQLPLWRQHLDNSIRNATPLRANPCVSGFIPKSAIPQILVFYVNMDMKSDGSPDISDYFYVAHCVGTWGLSPHGLHEGVRTLQPSQHTTLHIVGVPYSTYSYLRPPTLLPWTMKNISESEKDIILDNFAARSRINTANDKLTTDDLVNLFTNTGHTTNE
ncbi:protein O-linked-mannose beta-1,2-N-acetylglucosaminyltransferase 1-like [Penaeus monodon]|uniref:protein O-linked-mannose beta-1,2-N-acetylglucosaminyltransferase 1-like n=1 Tax=Penaeus monodon TaxID=6687 RepID=UPI0018A7AE08|nr:protein O-linked-mannose beta-1,2-N-acetylglucosaminyltransferase 1-like [Penaeus monodon]